MHVVERCRIVRQRPFALGRTVEVVEHAARQRPLGQQPKIIDVAALCQTASTRVPVELAQRHDGPQGLQHGIILALARSQSLIESNNICICVGSVRGFTKHIRKTVSPLCVVGTTNAIPSCNMRSLQEA